MRVPRARHMLLALVIVAAVLVAATAPSFGAAQRKSAPIEITFVDRVTSPTHDKFVKYLVDTFNQRNDGKIHVTYSGIPVNSYVAKIPLVLKSSKSPDVFFSYEAGFAKYIVDSGWSAPLDKYWTKYGWTKEITRPRVMSPRSKGTSTSCPTTWPLRCSGTTPTCSRRTACSRPRRTSR